MHEPPDKEEGGRNAQPADGANKAITSGKKALDSDVS
jgi:hypothetical protein